MKNPLDKLSKEHVKFLVDLGKKMNKQDNRSTAHVLFMVSVEKKIYVSKDWDYEEVERIEDSWGDMCDKCKKKEENDKKVPNFCEDCDDDCFAYFKKERVTDDTAGVFFTAQACDDHIKRNHYHYCKPKSYGICAWRNDEMQEVQKILSILGSKEGKVEYNYI